MSTQIDGHHGVGACCYKPVDKWLPRRTLASQSMNEPNPVRTFTEGLRGQLHPIILTGC
jgi:hypothetical protein